MHHFSWVYIFLALKIAVPYVYIVKLIGVYDESYGDNDRNNSAIYSNEVEIFRVSLYFENIDPLLQVEYPGY